MYFILLFALVSLYYFFLFYEHFYYVIQNLFLEKHILNYKI